MFAPDNESVPAPDFCNAPVPETTPEYVSASERLKVSVPEFATLPVAIDPVVDPAPTLTVPAEIVSAPVNVFAPFSVSVPVPSLVSLPFAPEITPANVASALPDVVKVFVALVLLRLIAADESLVDDVAIDATVSS